VFLIKRKEYSSNPVIYINSNFVPFVMIVCAGAWFGVFINSLGLQSRYWLLLSPFLLLSAMFFLLKFIRSEKAQRFVLICILLFYLLFEYGFIRKPHVLFAHSAQERSLEYRNDLKMHMDIAKEINDKYSNFRIGAPLTVAHILAYPELGYVDKQLDVMVYQFPSKQKRIKNFEGLATIDLKRTLWVGMNVHLPGMFAEHIPSYPVGERDLVLNSIIYGQHKARLFMGGESLEKVRLFQNAVLMQMRKNMRDR
jgi:hypothetical protein